MALISQDEILEQVMECVADVRVMNVSELQQEMVEEGDVIIDSLEVMVLLTMLEERWGCELPSPEDREIDQENSILMVVSLVSQKLRSAA